VATPVFMPCGTAGSIKGLLPRDLRDCGVQMLLGNTYHLMLRPGGQAVAQLGGLHRLMAWDGPILTDSGGYQVFSLAQMRTLSDEGVLFQSHVDGSRQMLSPQSCMAIQAQLGADVVMQLDQCPSHDAPCEEVADAVRRSALWAGLCRDAWQANPRPYGYDQDLFGIQQGGVHLDLREESARQIVGLDLSGYAIGGLSVGEGPAAMTAVLEHIDGHLPPAKPRYLMGVGEPRDILAGVASGIDMFDCVLPTRNARNAQAFTWRGRLKLRNAAHARDSQPLEELCPCYACRNFSRGALRHYFMAGEMLGPILLTMHNLSWFGRFMAAIRQAIADADLPARTAQWMQQLYGQ
jgi:queuine tRNA-ribosyltransferase